jgi:hypothetical protein
MFLKPSLYSSIFALVTYMNVDMTAVALAKDRESIPIEIWRGGDDGATIKFSEAIKAALAASHEFVLSHGNKPGTIFVTIPTNVRWRQVGEREEISYVIELMQKSPRRTERFSGSCWLDELVVCADQILKKGWDFRQ